MAGLISGLLNAATAGVAGYGQGKEQAQNRDQSLALLLAQRQEQQRMDDARIAADNARANRPVPVARNPVADHAAERDYDIKHPLPRAAGTPRTDPTLMHALSATQREESMASGKATAAQRAFDTEFPGSAPAHVDPTLPAQSGYFGTSIGAHGPTPNPDYPAYKADSTARATAADRVQRALATRDSLSGVVGKMSSRLNAEAMGEDPGEDSPAAPPARPARRAALPAPAAQTAPPAAAPAGATHLPEAAAAFKMAAQALQAAGGPSNPQARAQYDRIVAGISDHFQLTAPAPGGTQATSTPDE